MSGQPAGLGGGSGGSFHDNVQHADRTLHNNSATPEDLRNALRILFLCFREVQEEADDLRDLLAEAQAEVATAKAEKRTKRRKKKAGEAEENEEPTIESLTSSLGKFYVLFVTPYTGNHLFEGVTPELAGWTRDDIGIRFAKAFPNNARVGEALDLLHYAVETLKSKIIEMDLEIIKWFNDAAEAKRSEAVRRGRDNGPEIFAPLRERISAEIDRVKSQGVDLSFKRGKATAKSVSVLQSFSKDLFAPPAAPCCKKLPGLLELIGVMEIRPGVYKSDPFCKLIYRNYEKVSGEEFLADVLFRFARAVIYGYTYINTPEDLVTNTNSPIAGFELRATPGAIALLCILARIVLSPDDCFTRDGKGPVTSIQWIEDFGLYFYILSSIWEEDGGKAIADEWNRKVFPHFARQSGILLPSTAREAAQRASDESPPLRSAADDIIAHHRIAALPPQEDEEEIPFIFPAGHDANNDSIANTPAETTYQEEEDSEFFSGNPTFRPPSPSPQPLASDGGSSLLSIPVVIEPPQSTSTPPPSHANVTRLSHIEAQLPSACPGFTNPASGFTASTSEAAPSSSTSSHVDSAALELPTAPTQPPPVAARRATRSAAGNGTNQTATEPTATSAAQCVPPARAATAKKSARGRGGAAGAGKKRK